MSSVVASAVLRRISSALFSSPAAASAPKTTKSLLSLPNETLNEIACLLDKPALVALVLVNRRFHALVEPLIWRELTSLVPILRLLPEYFVKERMIVLPCTSTESKEIRCTRPVGPALPKDIWSRNLNILRLSSHVRKLLLHPISNLPKDCVHPTFSEHGCRSMTWEALKLVAKSIHPDSGLVLLPNLQHLEVDSCFSCGMGSTKLSPFLGPSVTTFVAHCSVARFYRCLRRCNISSFSYCEPPRDLYGTLKPADTRDASLIPAIRAVAQEIDRLHTLRLRLNHGSGLFALLQPAASTLRTLDIEIVNLADPTTNYQLSTLRSLTVRNQTTAFARALAGSVCLEHVDLDGVQIRNTNDFHQTLQRLAQGALRRVSVHEDPRHSSSLWSIEPRHLNALLSCSRLVELNLCVSSAVSLGDGDWASLLPSWPALKSLKLQHGSQPHRHGDARPITTLDTLVHFATHCRELEELKLPLLVGEVPDFAHGVATGVADDATTDCSRNKTAVAQRCLRELDLGCRSLIKAEVDPTRVASFLHALFPVLRDLVVTPQPQDLDAWDEVKAELAAL
ncbi:hypothetical protein EV121DRAFT_287818 [Schizophyllum commune]